MRQATRTDLVTVSTWIDSESSCRFWAGPLVSYPISVDVLIREIEFQETNSYIALLGKDLAGFGQILPRPNGVNHLARIIVNPELRGKGYGTGLLEGLVSVASNNASTLSLNVYRANNIALDVYKKLGFVEDGSRSTDENVFMVKT